MNRHRLGRSAGHAGRGGVKKPVQARPKPRPQEPPAKADDNLPFCACGCGKKVKASGRKLASRNCIGVYNARKRSTVSEGLVEECIKLARQVPPGARKEFFQRVLSLLEFSENLEQS